MSLHVLKPIDTDGPANIPGRLRELADAIEEGQYKPKTLIVIQDLEGGGVDTLCIGYRPIISVTLGLLEFAKQMYYEKARS